MPSAETLRVAVAVSLDRITGAGPGDWWFVHHPDGFLIEIGAEARARQIAAEINRGRALLSQSEEASR